MEERRGCIYQLITEQMKILKKTRHYQLNEGDGMAEGLYNISTRDGERVSNWLFPEDAIELKNIEKF